AAGDFPQAGGAVRAADGDGPPVRGEARLTGAAGVAVEAEDLQLLPSLAGGQVPEHDLALEVVPDAPRRQPPPGGAEHRPPSAPPEARSLPPGAKAAAATAPPCPRSLRRSRPVALSHR